MPSQGTSLLLALMTFVTLTSSVLYYLQQSDLAPSLPAARGHAAAPAGTWIDLPVSTRPRKTVLLYTRLQGTFENWRRRFGESFDECRWSRCEVTTERAALPAADALLFSLYDLRPDEPLPPHGRGARGAHGPGRAGVVAQWRRKVGPRVAPVVWVSSHCHTESQRETYVRQMRDTIDIDVYGECGELSCPITKKGFCMRLFQQHYTFMLAFENALCEDYVTEKFFNALQYGLVPVVLGGANYSRLAPPGSFVDAQQFASPRHLAEHLLHLSGAPAELARLHAWRNHHRVYSGERHFTWWKCELCRRLHERRAHVHHTDMYRFMLGEQQCQGSWQAALAARYGRLPQDDEE
ncbi:3-galactosyl-N-acetylglucosaminide 4-alpha-L-fucosyltransferase FUT3-like [Pollicipes pollicipes]|uniref:3-galactosyl-N-acetylglucosaminide 4-alpha-L-fucosyltransferase FUT3-like n=1 Tax=Pollicipes pollicipes TaxID=41117 RepID=UPI001884D066|nr:3-galactosyl-N-acetylglucosaminide 4-alpha-L-fucosyltransferase FUT3-like [Pollicipes pollicipes]